MSIIHWTIRQAFVTAVASGNVVSGAAPMNELVYDQRGLKTGFAVSLEATTRQIFEVTHLV